MILIHNIGSYAEKYAVLATGHAGAQIAAQKFPTRRFEPNLQISVKVFRELMSARLPRIVENTAHYQGQGVTVPAFVIAA